MKLRWKFFFILLVFSLIPLGIVTIVSQRGMSRMGAVISCGRAAEPHPSRQRRP